MLSEIITLHLGIQLETGLNSDKNLQINIVHIRCWDLYSNNGLNSDQNLQINIVHVRCWGHFTPEMRLAFF